MHFATSHGATTGVITSGASLTFVDLLPLIEEIEIYKCFVAFCVFNPDLGFDNGTVISLSQKVQENGANTAMTSQF